MLEQSVKMNKPGKNDIWFTSRELQCLAKAAEGNSLSQIAETLGITQHSVRFYFVSIKKSWRWGL